MTKLHCDRESEILELLGAGRTDGFGNELDGHVDQCTACADLVSVAGALLDDRRSLVRNAVIPGSGLVWWRATMRAQQEAARAAARTARAVQVALLAAAFVIAVLAVGGHAAASDLKDLLSSAPYAFVTLGVPIFALATWLILAPVAVYFVVSEE